MKKFSKIFGTITLVAMIGLLFPACPPDGGGSGGGNHPGTYTGYDSGGSEYKLVITPNNPADAALSVSYSARAIIPAVGDNYTLTVDAKKSEGTVSSVSDGSLTLNPSNSTTTFNATVTGDNGLTNVSGLITFDDNTTQQGPGALTPTNPGSGGGTGGPAMWTAVTDSTFGSSSIDGIAYGGGMWAVAGSIKIAHSQNGTSWTAAVNSAFTGDSYINGIAYGSNKFVAVGDYGKMAYSANGITWASVSATTFDSREAINGIAHNGLSSSNGRFVAVGDVRRNPDNTSTGLGQIAYSPDGTDWTAVTDIKIDTHINGIAYGGGMWIAVGNNGKMAYSSDGETWTAVTDSKFGTSRIISIAYGGGKFVAVGVNGKMAYSANGITWTAVTYNIASDTTYNTINGIAYGKNIFVAVGYGGGRIQMAYLRQ